MVARAVEEFVRASLPPPAARVLEIGAGDGELAARLGAAGYEVVAIDPAGEGAVLPVALLELDEPHASFDAALAVVSLHHVEPLEPSCRRLAEVVRPGGTLVVDEFDVGLMRPTRAPAGRRPGRRGRRAPRGACAARRW